MTYLRRLIFALFPFLCIPLVFPQSGVSQAQLTFTTIDVPGSGFTNVAGINTAGDMVGYYGASDSAFKHAFLLSGGIFTYFDYPGADATFAYGINDSGFIVGSAEFQGGLTGPGFIYDGSTFTPVRVGNKPITACLAINNAGQIVGTAGIAGADFRGFKMRNGHAKVINFPGQYDIANPTGVNSFGVITGSTYSGGTPSAYVYRNGSFSNLNFPGARQTAAYGINDKGMVVGVYFVPGSCYGFAFKNGKYISFGYPGALCTGGSAINGSGQIVGQYQLPDYTWHGFVTSPITPTDFENRSAVR
jgi:uncharacterized membrane protein